MQSKGKKIRASGGRREGTDVRFLQTKSLHKNLLGENDRSAQSEKNIGERSSPEKWSDGYSMWV